MNCTNCGYEVPDGALFCPECGTRVAYTSETTRIGLPPSTGPTTKLTSDPTVRSVQGTAKTLRIGKMLADITIYENNNISSIQVSLSGDPQSLAQFTTNQVGNELQLTCPLPYKTSGLGRMISRVVSNTKISINNSTIVIDGGTVDLSRKIQCDIEVPAGTSVIIDEFYGDLTIEDLIGDLELKYNGTDDIFLGSMGNLKVVMNSSGEITIAELRGTLDAQLNSIGGLQINSGSIHDLRLVHKGSGEFIFSGDTVNANLELYSTGGVSIGDITGNVEFKNYGSGDVNTGHISGDLKVWNGSTGAFIIEDGDLNALNIHNQGSGGVLYQGAAREVSLTETSNGEIEIQQITGTLAVENKGSADIIVSDMNVSNLVAALFSNGNIYLSGTATQGSFTNYGSGDITVDEVSGDVSIEITNSGSVTISDGTVGILMIENKGSGDIEYSGSAQEAHLSVTSIGGITLFEVLRSLVITNRGSGDINISNGDIENIIAELYSIGNISFDGSTNYGDLKNFGSGDISVSGGCTGELITRKTSIGQIYVG